MEIMLFLSHDLIKVEKEGENMIEGNCVDMENSSGDLCSYLLFCVGGRIFSIKTTDIVKIQKADSSILALPDMPTHIRGSLKTTDGLFSVMDLRQLFGWKTTRQEFRELSEMIDARKQDHINWVRELKKSYMSKIPFELPKNQHNCALGIWRDNYMSTSSVTQHLLARLDMPHGKLHKLAYDVLKDDAHSSSVMDEIETVWMPSVLKILDEIKIQFQEQVTREIFILIHGEINLAITADTVLCIEPIQKLSICDATLIPNHKSFVKNIFQRDFDSELIMELDIAALIENLYIEKELNCEVDFTL